MWMLHQERSYQMTGWGIRISGLQNIKGTNKGRRGGNTTRDDTIIPPLGYYWYETAGSQYDKKGALMRMALAIVEFVDNTMILQLASENPATTNKQETYTRAMR